MTLRPVASVRLLAKSTGRACFKPMTLVVIFLVTCATSYPQANVPEHDWIRTEIYFGLSQRNGKPISNEAWLRFANRSLSSAFPDGFTVIRGAGEWTDKNHRHFKESTRVLVVVYPKAGAQAIDEAIRKVVDQYIREFNQDAVLRVDSKADVSFYRRDDASIKQ
jgi:hypothetical protein